MELLCVYKSTARHVLPKIQFEMSNEIPAYEEKKVFHRFFISTLAVSLVRRSVDIILCLVSYCCSFQEKENELRGCGACVAVLVRETFFFHEHSTSLIEYRQENATVKFFNAREAGNERNTCIQEN